VAQDGPDAAAPAEQGERQARAGDSPGQPNAEDAGEGPGKQS